MAAVITLRNLLFVLVLNILSAFAISAEHSDNKNILILGDSISAGFGVPLQQGWVALLSKELQRRGAGVSIINASISGDTTQGGLTRLPNLLQQHTPDLVIIELGGNDGLRGTPIKRITYNLEQLIHLCHEAGSGVMLAGMQIPPNYGRQYTQSFREIFPTLAKNHQTLLIPFLLKTVADNPEMLQADGIHPTAAAQPLMTKEVLPFLDQWLKTTQPYYEDEPDA